MSINFNIDPADTRPIYMQIMDEVRALVLETLKPDDPLPSVRQLAADLRVNPNTVQQAYRELERGGLIYVRRGQGTFVSQSAEPAVERETISRQVAERALRDAYLHGLTYPELINALEGATEITDYPSEAESKGVTR